MKDTNKAGFPTHIDTRDADRAPARALGAALCVLCLGAVASCTGLSGPNLNEMPTRGDGAAFFAQNCASCHGAQGRGDGPAARGLTAPPPDLTQLSRDNGGTFPETEALAYIYGDPEDGHLARVMPEFGGAMAEDLVPLEVDGVLTPTPRELAGLLYFLESIQE